MVGVVGKVAPHRDFAKRLEQAADGMAHEIPPPNFGRLRWFQEQVEKVTGDRPSPETVRKWIGGLVLPRKATVDALAEILQVDAGWLMFGRQDGRATADRSLRNAEAEGVVNVLAGVIQMDGGHPAFPEPGEDTIADLFAIIRGARYSFKVVVGEVVEGGYRFLLPPKAGDVIVIGVIRAAPHNFAFFEIDPALAQRDGKRVGAQISVVADPRGLKQIESFGQRI